MTLAGMAVAETDFIDGWKAVIAVLEQVSGVERSRFTLWRYARRKTDPLPLRKALNGRPRADRSELEAWWKRHKGTY